MTNLVNKMYFKAMMAKEQVKRFLQDETGDTNIIAIILILAIVIALAIVFKNSINALFTQVWNKLRDNAVNNI